MAAYNLAKDSSSLASTQDYYFPQLSFLFDNLIDSEMHHVS